MAASGSLTHDTPLSMQLLRLPISLRQIVKIDGKSQHLQDRLPILYNLSFGENFFEKPLNIHFPLLYFFGFMVEQPVGLQQCVFDIDVVLLQDVLLYLQELAVPQKYLLSNTLNPNFDDVDGILKQRTVPLLGPQDLDLRQKIQPTPLLQKLQILLILHTTQTRQLLQVLHLRFHQLTVNLLDQILFLLLTLALERTTIPLPILHREVVLIKKAVFILHDISASIFEGHRSHENFFIFDNPRNDNFGIKKIHGALDKLIFFGKNSDWFLEYKLDSRLRNHVRQHQIPLNLANFVAIYHLVQLLIVAVVDFLEHLQHPVDISAIRMVGRSHPSDFLHDEHVFGQSLHRLYEKVPKSQQMIFRIDPDTLHEFLEA